jgi:hypothetical protein
MMKVRLDRTIERDGCECRGGPTDCCDQGWETVGAQKVERVSRKTSELLNPQDTRTECAWEIISVLIQGIAQALSITVAQYFKMLLIYLFMQCSVSLTSVHSQKANTYHSRGLRLASEFQSICEYWNGTIELDTSTSGNDADGKYHR